MTGAREGLVRLPGGNLSAHVNPSTVPQAQTSHTPAAAALPPQVVDAVPGALRRTRSSRSFRACSSSTSSPTSPHPALPSAAVAGSLPAATG